MGSWNETCHLANYSISPGDPVRYMLICETPTSQANASYHTGYWFPMSTPIKAKYADYGQVDEWDKESIFFKSFLTSLKKNIVAKEDHELSVSAESLDMEHLMEWIHGNKLYVKNHDFETGKPSNLQVGQLLISETAWQSSLTMELEAWDRPSKVLTLEDYEWDIGQAIEVIRASKRGNGTHSALLGMGIDPRNVFSHVLNYGGSIPSLGYDFEKQLKGIAIDFLNGNVTEKHFQEFLTKSAEFFFIDDLCEQLRKPWHPTCGHGGQDQHHLLVEQWHDAMSSATKNVMQARIDEEG